MAPPRSYRIEVQGPVPAGVAEELPAMAVAADGARTTLTGPVADAAALYGLIARLEALGLTLLSVQPINEEDTDVAAAH